MVTIADVAAHAGVGAGTVSRVLNDSPQVRPRTRARVEASIELLGYRPHPAARALVRGRCQTLGVVVPFFTHASAIERLRGVVAALDESRYDLVLFNVESSAHRAEHLAALTRRDRADGLLIMSLPLPRAELARLRGSGVPVVLVDAKGTGVPRVTTDDVEGGRIAARHLIAQGHRRIAFIGDRGSSELAFTAGADRERGFREELQRAGLPADDELVRLGPHDRVVAEQLAAELLALPEPPTAVFASSDVQALGVLAAARAAGRRVPEDLSVVGFDDVELSAYVGLTTVRQPLRESGALGARLLLDALTGDGAPAPEVHELSLELIERNTTGPPPRRVRS